MAREHRLTPGSTFAGLYEVERMLGQGTMGAVYMVRERGTGTPRALKLMKAELLEDPKFPARFAQEAQVGARIGSPHVVEVVASGVDPASRLPWLAMELLQGETLADLLEAANGPLDRELAQTLLGQLFGALAAAHAANIVHRDLKPENVILVGGSAAPFVKVLDFGVAKVLRETTTLTGTVAGLGTPLWTAPEQAREGANIRPAADVWALGLITFRVLSGKAFWRAANDAKSSAYDVALELVRAPIPRASERAKELGAADLPLGFDAWFARCVEREPAARFETAADAQAALTALFSSPPLAPAAAAKKPRWVVGILIALLMATAVTIAIVACILIRR